MFSASCLSWVPEQGTVGASGDLAPLSHLALGLMGEGHMWSPHTGWGEAKYVLESHNLTPIRLEAKEGLALINGTQLITSIGAEAVERASIIARQADVVAALTLEVLKGTSRAFDSGEYYLFFPFLKKKGATGSQNQCRTNASLRDFNRFCISTRFLLATVVSVSSSL